MALTFTVTDVTPGPTKFPSGGVYKERIVIITPAGTYTDRGDTLTAAQLGFEKIVLFQPDPIYIESDDNGYVVVYDYTNAKLRFFEGATASAGLDECDAGDDLEGGSFRARVVGI